MTKKEIQEEMERKVLEVADYVIKQMEKGNNPSTRSVAADLTKAFNDKQLGIGSDSECKVPTIKISNATVCVYLSQKLPKIDPVRYKLVKPIIDKNTPKTIKDVIIRERIYKSVYLLFKGLTIPQIVEELNASRTEEDKVTFDIIYGDLTTRLSRIEKDEHIISDVKKRLQENKLETLCNQGIVGPNLDVYSQPRDESGKFISKKK